MQSQCEVDQVTQDSISRVCALIYRCQLAAPARDHDEVRLVRGHVLLQTLVRRGLACHAECNTVMQHYATWPTALNSCQLCALRSISLDPEAVCGGTRWHHDGA